MGIITVSRGETIEWAGLIRVDNTLYTWMGNPNVSSQAASQTAFEYTATRSTFVLNAGGKVELNVTFLSPVTPNDIELQSLTFSYLDVSVESVDGKNHDVQLYVDTSAGKLFYKTTWPLLKPQETDFFRLGYGN